MALIQPVIFCTAPSVPIQPADLKAAMTVVSSALQSGATPVVTEPAERLAKQSTPTEVYGGGRRAGARAQPV